MVVGGLPHPCDNHAQKVVTMGCSMMEATDAVHSPVDKHPIKVGCTVGTCTHLNVPDPLLNP
jgi:guanylate cyclase soluble subunit beta